MLANFLLGPFRASIPSALLWHPDASWYSRESARRLGALRGSTNRELVKLAVVGILLRQKIGNQVCFRANQRSPIFLELAGILKKTLGMATVLADTLMPLVGHIQCALVFGSVARGEETTHFDVDVLIMGNIDCAEVIEALHPVQNQLQLEINPVFYRAYDFRVKLASNDTWAHEVVDKAKLFLIGDEDDIAKLVADPEHRQIQRPA